MVQKQTREGIESTTRPLWVQAMVQASTMRRPKSRVYGRLPNRLRRWAEAGRLRGLMGYSVSCDFWRGRGGFFGVKSGRLEKPETGIRNRNGMGTGTGTGTGNGNVTGKVMWRGTDTRTGTSFTLNYFNSNSIYTKNKKTSLVSCSPPNLFILRQREGRKSHKLNK